MTAHLTHPFQKIPLLLLLLLCCGGGAAWSQVSTYSFTSSSGTYTPIPAIAINPLASATATSSVGSLDNASFAVTLPFTFNFGNSAFTTAYVSTNGSIGFGSNNTVAVSALNDNTPGGAVAAFNTDLRGIFSTTANTVSGNDSLKGLNSIGNIAVGQTIVGPGIKTGTTVLAIGTNSIKMSDTATATSSSAVGIVILSGNMSTAISGSAPNRVFTIQWSGFQVLGVNDFSVDFQIKLSEAGGVPAAQTVSVIYGNSVNLSGSGGAQVGLRSNWGNTNFLPLTSTSSWTSPTIGTNNLDAIAYSSTNMPAAGQTYLFTPPAACSGTPTAGTLTASSNPLCAGTRGMLTLNGFTTGTGISLQWSSSLDNINFTPSAGMNTIRFR
jgi:hypothetical protein